VSNCQKLSVAKRPKRRRKAKGFLRDSAREKPAA
jgi:hypothetical protein